MRLINIVVMPSWILTQFFLLLFNQILMTLCWIIMVLFGLFHLGGFTYLTYYPDLSRFESTFLNKFVKRNWHGAVKYKNMQKQEVGAMQ